jgi:hypothetical protein
VQKAIFCPIADVVLDIRTARYVVGEDGWPKVVWSPEGVAHLASYVDGDESRILSEGNSFARYSDF